jgi:lipopolysaccharide/colanic/teichoic acid biosynthesis glycosyltransferase
MTRLVDILGAAILLLIVLPILLLIAILIVLDSPGPILFRQERIGRDMKPFLILKLRTMHGASDAFEFKPQRITNVGEWLRRWKLDELPQLMNVLRGEMSFVGPRPEIRKYVEMFRGSYQRLLVRRPGLTDPATLAYRQEAEILANEPDPEQVYVSRILPEKLRLSEQYAMSRTFRSDIHVLLRTLAAVLIQR